MKPHEWHEQDEEARERRYYRATKFGKKWSIITTLKSEPDWHKMDNVPLPVLEMLRVQLRNKYQRRRVPYEDVLAVDQMVVDAGGEAEFLDHK